MSNANAGLNKRREKTAFDEGNLKSRVVSADRSGAYGSLRVVSVDSPSASWTQDSFARFGPKPLDAYPRSKRIFDIAGACLMLVVFSPLILVLVACSFSSGGSPIFRHPRVGQGGVFFDCLKFRTMVQDADKVLQTLIDGDRKIKEEWLKNHKLKNDPRITRFGRFLRRTSLDELPQLWNVLRGEMSLVGPRPVVPEELSRYGRRVGTFLAAKPGITGLWQVSGRNDTDYRRRVAQDICYVRRRSLKIDFYILIRTFPAVFAKSGAY